MHAQRAGPPARHAALAAVSAIAARLRPLPARLVSLRLTPQPSPRPAPAQIWQNSSAVVVGINLDGEAATRAMLEQQGLGKAPEGTQADLEEMSWLESVAASAGECFMRAAWRTWRAPGHLAAALTHLPASLLCRWRILLRAQQHRPAARQGGVRPGLQEPGEVLAAVRVGARSMPQQRAAGCARGAQRGSRPARASPRPTTRSWPANTGQVVSI